MVSKIFVQNGQNSNRDSARVQTFYSIIRPTAIFCKILGTFYIMNSLSNDGRFLQYKFLSFTTFFSPIIQFIAILLYWKYQTYPWWITISSFQTLRSISVILICLCYDKFLVDLIQSIEIFDEIYYVKCGHSPSKTFIGNGTVWLLIYLFVFLITIPSVFLMINSYSETSFTRAVINCALGLTTWVPFETLYFLYILLCINIASRYIDLASYLRSIVGKLISGKYNNNGAQCDNELEGIRLLYYHLSDAVTKLNKSYGIKLVNIIMCCFIQMIMDIYQCSY
ncbi:hypothetical protein L9F63_015346, partial [Diploptera punctata]